MAVVTSCIVVLLAALVTIWLLNALWKAAERREGDRLDCLTCRDSGCDDCGPERDDDDLFTQSLFKVGASKRVISVSRRAQRESD